jgi:hypothetical protein
LDVHVAAALDDTGGLLGAESSRSTPGTASRLVTQRNLDDLLHSQPEADDRLIAAETADEEELVELNQLGPDDPRTKALASAWRRRASNAPAQPEP